MESIYSRAIKRIGVDFKRTRATYCSLRSIEAVRIRIELEWPPVFVRIARYNLLLRHPCFEVDRATNRNRAFKMQSGGRKDSNITKIER